MGKSIHDEVLDIALNYLLDNITVMNVCNAEPTSYAEATTFNLAEETGLSFGAISPVDATSGRKAVLPEVPDINITVTGDATHVAFTNGVDKLLYVTTCTTQSLTNGNLLTIPSSEVNLRDPQ